MKKRQLKPYQGILFLALIIAAMIFVAGPMQYYWGMAGLAATELLFLAMSLLYVLLLKGDFKEVFPVKKVQAAPFFGTILMWVGTFLLTMVLTLVVMYLFPEQMMDTGNDLNEFFVTVPMLLMLFIGAVLPAVCEEAVHRGVIMNSLLPMKNKWVIILVVGILFGINHLSLWRFLPTAILGGAMGYIMYETRNILYTVLFHFLNNAFSLVVTELGPSADSAGALQGSQELILAHPQMILMSLGVYMMLASVGPFLLYTAAYLVRRGGDRTASYFPQKRKGLVLGLLIGFTGFLAIGGFFLIVGTVLYII